ncbi:MAG: aldehyde oxidase [Blastococcus sp.]|nr:aldehyde oxidase [Blastococcus sp.]
MTTLERQLPAEDTGDGRFADDVEPAHLLHMAVGRCPYTHARIDRTAIEPRSVLRPVPGAPQLPYYALPQDVATHEGQAVVSVVATNPTVVDGQARGALAQGFGAALTEELRYDRETGQLVNGSLMEYFVPTAGTATEVPDVHLDPAPGDLPDGGVGY